MGKALTTLGMGVRWAAETEKGKRPTTGYKELPDIKSLPAVGGQPDTHESTTLAATKYKTHEMGLIDPGSALSYSANYTAELITEWGALVTAYEAAEAAGLSVWFEHFHPALDVATFFTGVPAPLNHGEVGTNGILEATAYVVMTNEPEVLEKSTAPVGEAQG